MRRPRWSTLLVLAVVSGAGLATGQLLARAGAERFDVNAWPRRGAGPRLVEYFDPRCAASRAVHLRLAAELGDAPWVEHVLVPVALSRGVKPAPADRLCALGGDAAFTTALAWALQGGPPAAATDGEPDARTRACAAQVEAATVHTGALNPDGVAAAPVVELDGRIYAGQQSLDALEAALRAVRR